MNSVQAEQAIKRVTFDTDKLSKTGREAERSVRSLNTSFDHTARGAGNLRLSAEKAGIGFKNLVVSVLDSKQPVMDLAQSMSYLTRAFKVGVAGTVGIVAISEVIKGLTKENAQLDETTKSLNDTIKTFSKNMTTLSFEGAIGQANALGDALDKAFEKMNEPSFMEKLGQGVGDIFTGGAKKRAAQAVVKTAGAIETANQIAEENLQLQVQIGFLAERDKFEAKRLEINGKFNSLIKQAIKDGRSKEFIGLLEVRQGQELLKVDKQQNDEAAKAAKEKEQLEKENQQLIQSNIDYQNKLKTDAELYDSQRARNLERTRKELADQVKLNENLLQQEQQKAAVAKAAAAFQEVERKNAERSRQAGSMAEGILGSTKAGKATLANAEKRRQREIVKENFKFAQQVAPTQRDREALAAQVAAGKVPSLKEVAQAEQEGIAPEQLAQSRAISKFEESRKPFGRMMEVPSITTEFGQKMGAGYGLGEPLTKPGAGGGDGVTAILTRIEKVLSQNLTELKSAPTLTK